MTDTAIAEAIARAVEASRARQIAAGETGLPRLAAIFDAHLASALSASALRDGCAPLEGRSE